MRSLNANLYALLCALLIACFDCGCRPFSTEATVDASAQAEVVDREYRLKATMLGYFGIGGEIDGDKNPTLTAEQGDRVRITIVNGELMVHDIAMERHGAASAQILEEGAESSLIFTARTDDTYYCTVPGHRLAGMVGNFRLVEAGPAIGVLPEKEGRPLNLDFETGTLEGWLAVGNALERQPMRGSVIEERRGRRMGHVGEYFIATHEVYGDTATGSSPPKRRQSLGRCPEALRDDGDSRGIEPRSSLPRVGPAENAVAGSLDDHQGACGPERGRGGANIPLLLWYAMAPLAAEDPERVLTMALQAKIPQILSFTLRRISAPSDTPPPIRFLRRRCLRSRKNLAARKSKRPSPTSRCKKPERSPPGNAIRVNRPGVL